jgi:hypothetical protein
MPRRPPAITAVLALVVCAACTTADGTTSSLTSDPSPRFAKPVSGLPDPTVTWMLPSDAAARGLAFRSDGQFSSGGFSAYANGVCGVTTWVEMASTDPFPGFAHLSLGTDKKTHCTRSLTVFYPDGITESASGATQRGLTEPRIEKGATVLRTLAILSGSPAPAARCGRVLFGEGSQGAGVGSDSVRVTRSLDGVTWHVQSNVNADGTARDLALCENTGVLFHMPVDFLISADDPTRFP